MEAICTKDLLFGGYTLYKKGEIYEFDLNDDGTYKMKTNFGVGCFTKNDPTFKKHFKKEGDFGYKRLRKKVLKGRL